MPSSVSSMVAKVTSTARRTTRDILEGPHPRISVPRRPSAPVLNEPAPSARPAHSGPRQTHRRCLRKRTARVRRARTRFSLRGPARLRGGRARGAPSSTVPLFTNSAGTKAGATAPKMARVRSFPGLDDSILHLIKTELPGSRPRATLSAPAPDHLGRDRRVLRLGALPVEMSTTQALRLRHAMESPRALLSS